MALTTILRRSASSVVPLAAGFMGCQRYNHHCSALFSAVNHSDLARKFSPNSSFPSTLHYSSSSALESGSSDDSLLRVLESEIECAQESGDNEVQGFPEDLPFKIEDKPGQQTISLSRKYQGETIYVEVDTTTTDGEDDDDEDDDDTEKGSQTCVPMIVRVSKKGVPCLEFNVSAFLDEIVINSLSIKYTEVSEDQIPYEGPGYDDLEDNLQKAFHTYLEIRGIKPSTTNFLHEYMINKDNREYIRWLKKLKNFVEA